MNFLASPYDYLQMHKTVIFGVLLGIAVLGLLYDLARKTGRTYHETLSNLTIFAGNTSVNLLIAQPLQLAGLGWIVAKMPWQIPTNLYSFLLCIVALDFCYYWRHRWEHEINLLWTEHSVHHSSEEFNFSTAVRLPIVNPPFGWIFFTPLAIAGFPAKLIVASFMTNLIYQYWVHNGSIRRLGWVEFVLSTPSNHRVHHARNPEYRDKNYGGIFMVWDLLFNTYAPEAEKPDFGIVEPIGTSNPVLVNVLPFVRLWKKATKQPTLGRKLRVIFGPPGLKFDA